MTYTRCYCDSHKLLLCRKECKHRQGRFHQLPFWPQVRAHLHRHAGQRRRHCETTTGTGQHKPGGGEEDEERESRRQRERRGLTAGQRGRLRGTGRYLFPAPQAAAQPQPTLPERHHSLQALPARDGWREPVVVVDGHRQAGAGHL